MQFNHPRSIILAITVLLAIIPLNAARATPFVLDFSGNICGAPGNEACVDGKQIGQSYGDVAGQADISYALYTSLGVLNQAYLKFWGSGYGDLTGTVWGAPPPQGNYQSQITFTPLAGYELALMSFDVGCDTRTGTVCSLIDWQVTSSGYNNHAVAATNYLTHVTVSPNTPYFTTPLVLQWGPNGYDNGLDNITVDLRPTAASAVPEPSVWAMMIVGFAGIGIGMRRKRSTGLNARLP